MVCICSVKRGRAHTLLKLIGEGLSSRLRIKINGLYFRMAAKNLSMHIQKSQASGTIPISECKRNIHLRKHHCVFSLTSLNSVRAFRAQSHSVVLPSLYENIHEPHTMQRRIHENYRKYYAPVPNETRDESAHTQIFVLELTK